MRKLLSTLAVAALLAGYAGGAQATEGWYVRADVGYSMDGEAPVNSFYDYYDEEYYYEESYQSEWMSGEVVDLHDDWMVDAGLGFAFDNGFRAEAELAQRTNEIESLDFDYYYSSSSIDNVYATSLMLNGFYDFNRDGQISPYVGIGVGWAKVAAGEDDDSKLAWQAMAGVGVALSERLSVDLGYRHFETDDLDYVMIPAGYEHEAVTLGLRYQLAVAAPIPVAQPAPPPPPPLPPQPVACPTSDFVVYFEWDRSELNQEAMATIDQAVARARQCHVNSVAIVGHTDTSGSNAYNMGLSERRAVIVRDALVARGMAMSMNLSARGETELAQPARDGVREPLNRRTAVTISFR